MKCGKQPFKQGKTSMGSNAALSNGNHCQSTRRRGGHIRSRQPGAELLRARHAADVCHRRGAGAGRRSEGFPKMDAGTMIPERSPRRGLEAVLF